MFDWFSNIFKNSKLYLSPETIMVGVNPSDNFTLTSKSDIFSLGLTFFYAMGITESLFFFFN